jgi:hypothetical protein
MDTFQAVAIVTSLFVIRFVVPLMLTVVIGYLLSRASTRWLVSDDQATPRIN